MLLDVALRSWGSWRTRVADADCEGRSYMKMHFGRDERAAELLGEDGGSGQAMSSLPRPVPPVKWDSYEHVGSMST